MSPRIIIAARGLLNWTQRDLATFMGMHQTKIARVENRISGLTIEQTRKLRLLFLDNGLAFCETDDFLTVTLIQKSLLK